MLDELVSRGLKAAVKLGLASFQRPEKGHRASQLNVTVDAKVTR